MDEAARVALGVAAIGGVFFARLGATLSPETYCAALVSALSCNLLLLAGTFLLVVLLRQGGSRSRQPRVSTRVVPVAPTAVDTLGEHETCVYAVSK